MGLSLIYNIFVCQLQGGKPYLPHEFQLNILFGKPLGDSYLYLYLELSNLYLYNNYLLYNLPFTFGKQ